MTVTREDIDSLNEWANTAKVLYACHHGKGINKELYATVGGKYEVYSKSKLVVSTSSPGMALSTYNSITRD